MKNIIMKFNFASSLKKTIYKKKFRYGGYATLVTAVVIAMLLILNLLVDQFDFMADLTRNQLFTLSEQTFGVLDGLEHEIDIISLNEPGAENPVAIQIIEQYTAHSPKVSFTSIDPVRNPQLVMRYQKDGETIAQGSIIVENREMNRFKIISAHELINFRLDQQQQHVPESLAVEQRLTGGIIYVTTEDLPVIYALAGHDQDPIPFRIRQQLELENYRIEEINLMTSSVPEDAHALLVTSPKRDLSDTEEQRLRNFLENQGRAIFLMDLMPQSLPRFESIFRSYGVELSRLLVVEGDANMHVGNPLWLVPDMEAHDVMTPLRSADMPMVIVPVSQALEIMDVRRRTLEIQPLLVTSESAWGKTNLETQTLEKEEGDLEGPFNIGVAVTDNVFIENETRTTKLIIMANAGFLGSDIIEQIPGNKNFLLNSLNWIQDREEAISIRPRSLATPRLNMNWQQQLILAGVAVVVIPFFILGAGLFVWLKRRHL